MRLIPTSGGWIETAEHSTCQPPLGLRRGYPSPLRSTLSGAWPAAKLAGVVKPRDEWKPYPRAADREAWLALPDNMRLEGDGPALRATQFLEYRREGNRSRYEASRNARRDRLNELVIAKCVEGKGSFLDEIANGVWLTCEETWWGVRAHLGAQKRAIGLPDVTEPIIDLFAAETGAQLAWVEHLLGPELEKVSPLLGTYRNRNRAADSQAL